MDQTDFLASSIDFLEEGILITDAKILDGTGPTIIYVNQAMERITGYRADELIGQAPRMMQCKETDRSVLDRIRSALQAGLSVKETLINEKKDGTKYFVEIKIISQRDSLGNIIRYISIQRDVTDEIRQGERLRAREESFRLLFDENPMAMFVVDRQTLKILKVNSAWLRIYGYDQKTALSLSSHNLRPDVPHEILVHDILEEASTGRLAGPYQVVTSNGTRFPAMTMRRLIDFNGREAVISMLWDVSELELARERVRDAMAQLEKLAAELTIRTKELSDAHRLAKVGSWYWDIRKRAVRFASEVWLMMGRPDSEVPVSYNQMRKILHPDDYQKTMDIYYRAVKERVAVTAEYRIAYPTGEIRELLSYAEPVFDEGNSDVVGLRGTSQDVTDFRAVEAKLRESEDHYRNMVDLHPQVPWTAAPDGSILDVGAKWTQLTGLTVEETLPHGWVKVVHPNDLPAVLREWETHLKNLEPFDIEYRVRHRNGEFIWVRVRAVARLDSRRRPMRWYGTMEDITDRRIAENARHQSEKLAARVLNATSDAIIVLNPSLEIQFTNGAAQKIFGDDIDIAGVSLNHFFGIRKTNTLIRSIQGCHKSQQSSDIEFLWKRRGMWFEVHIRPDVNEISIFMRDISDRKRIQRELQYAASHDPLTGAPNRTVLFNYLERYLKSGNRSERIAVMCIDMDFFKEINDTFGHPVGDALLKSVVYRIRSCIRSTDLLARIGGDEFVLLQTNVYSINDAENLANRMISTMKSAFRIDGREIKVAASIGISISNSDQITASEICKQADIALYNAKLRNRGGYLHFDPSMIDEFRRASELRSDLSGALDRREFCLAFQPIVRVVDQTVCGAEVLLRWHHPTRGYISPAQFIPLAEEAGYIQEIGLWVLQEACRIANSWPENITVSINVSVKQIEREDFIDVVERVLTETGLSANRLLLEITESVFFSKVSEFSKTIESLNSSRLQMVLDDFGTGYSSLAYLDTINFQKIKIDRSFISKIKCPGQSLLILEAIMGVARGLGLTVTAEGIETDEQLEYVRQIGCHEAQGYLFGKPMDEQAFVQIIPDHMRRSSSQLRVFIDE